MNSKQNLEVSNRLKQAAYEGLWPDSLALADSCCIEDILLVTNIMDGFIYDDQGSIKEEALAIAKKLNVNLN